MEDSRVLVDTSNFIEYFRKENKFKTKLYRFREDDYKLLISSVCYFEYMSGSKNRDFDKLLFKYIKVISSDKNQAEIASQIFQNLKNRNVLIEFRDILISSCAVSEGISLATLNKKHFSKKLSTSELIFLNLFFSFLTDFK